MPAQTCSSFRYTVCRHDCDLCVSYPKTNTLIQTQYILVTPFVNLFIEILKAPPAIEVIPEIIEIFDFLLFVLEDTEHRDRRFFAEPRFSLEYRPKSLEELYRIQVLGLFTFRGLEVGCGRRVLFERAIVRINGVKLTSPLDIGKDFIGFLDAFEKRVIIR